jgi:hypothetical protein
VERDGKEFNVDAAKTQYEISYFEYKVINELMHSHSKELGESLRAIIVFGALKTAGGTFDIELLEVIDGWQGPPQMQSASSAELPMRGRLYLSFVSAQDFEAICSHPAQQKGTLSELLKRVLEGYEIVYEVPTGYARQLLMQAQEGLDGRNHGEYISDPRSLQVLNRS